MWIKSSLWIWREQNILRDQWRYRKDDIFWGNDLLFWKPEKEYKTTLGTSKGLTVRTVFGVPMPLCSWNRIFKRVKLTENDISHLRWKNLIKRTLYFSWNVSFCYISFSVLYSLTVLSISCQSSVIQRIWVGCWLSFVITRLHAKN